jgi:diguanylate cyclase (GGDEF)-like protein/PAS domain S-box-containing protein
MSSSTLPDDRFRELFEQSGVAQALIARDGIITAINEAAAALFGRSPSEVQGQPLLSRLPEEDPDADLELLDQLRSGQRDRVQFERRLLRHDGRWMDALVSAAGVGSGGEVREISICLQDITVLKNAQREAERAEARWRSLSQNASDVALIVDEDLVIDYASPALTELLGYAEEDLTGRHLPSLAHPEDTLRIGAVMRRLIAEGGSDLLAELRLKSATGEWRRVEQRVLNLLADPYVAGLVVNLRDVTERHELQTTLMRATLEDPLTRLPNRALLMDRIEHAIEGELAGGGEYSLMLVNVDRLAAINDAFGHTTGDDVLVAAADALCTLVRPSDTVARYAGDEFAILLTSAGDSIQASALAERVTTALNTELVRRGEPTVHYSACVGLAHGPAETAEALVSAAAAATARAKELGRGRLHVLEDTARDRVAENRNLAAELASAVATDQLTVHYQPIVDLRTGDIASFEALVRWNHPRRGVLQPHTFLPMAEALDLQVRIDEWVLNEACRTAKTWPCAERGPISVSVNVAPAHLTAPDFAASVVRALEASQLDPALLTLEVTETAVVADVARAQQVLTTLSELGVRVAIDDFGTGYSSMLQLRQLPFHKLKIDREFVLELPSSTDDTAICASVISLADKLKVDVIAEGIEEQQQAAVLLSLGCRYGQGFLWSAAVPAAETTPLIDDRPWAVPATAPVPRRSRARQLPSADPAVVEHARAMHEAGASLHTIAASLNRDHVPSSSGRRWHPSTVARLLFPQTRP